MLWTPADTTTDLWLDASHASTITISTGVSQWRDKSGNSRHASQSTGGSQPSVAAAAQNGLSGVRFNGSQFLSCGDTLDIRTGNQTIFIVAKFATSGDQCLIAKSLSGPGIDRWSIYRYSNQLYGMYYYDYTTGGIDPTIGAFGYTSANMISTRLERGSAANYKIRLNGTLLNTTTFINESNDLNNAYRLLIGAYNNSNETGQVFYLNGDIYEIIILQSAVSDTLRYYIEGYLAWKWGLQASLPAGHPYYSAAPGTLFYPAMVMQSSQLLGAC